MARRKLSTGMRRKLQRGFAVLALLLLVVAIAVVAVLDHRVTAQFEGRRWTLPARVYAQPIDLYAGQQLSAQRFVDELERLGYLAAANADRPGTYRRRGEQVSVYVREFRFADGPQAARSRSARVRRATAIASLEDARAREVPVIRLDPLLIGSIFPIHGEDRIVVAPDEVPPLLPAALKAVEDRKFDSHHGVNPLAILRALFVNVRAGQIEQGGSTLTQQLVKSYFLDSRRTLRRKAEEAVMAVILESRFEKADIMNAYINEIYLGQDGKRAVHGFGLASQFYFGKPLAELDLPEIALMVGDRARPVVLRPAPPSRARARAAQPRAAGAGRAGRRERGGRRARGEEAARRRGEPGRKGGSYYPAFLDLVRRQLRQRLRGVRPHRGRASPCSARSTRCCSRRPRTRARRRARPARHARRARRRTASRAWWSSRRRRPARWPRWSAGGAPPSTASTARSTRKRPIGSLAKPLVYLAALEIGRVTRRSRSSHDEPVDLKLPNGDHWKPQNFDKQLRGARDRGAGAHAVAQPADGAPRPRRRPRQGRATPSRTRARGARRPNCRRCCSARPT